VSLDDTDERLYALRTGSRITRTLTETVIPLTIGVSIGFFEAPLLCKVSLRARSKGKSILVLVSASAESARTALDSAQALYDYSLDVMRRQAGVE